MLHQLLRYAIACDQSVLHNVTHLMQYYEKLPFIFILVIYPKAPEDLIRPAIKDAMILLSGCSSVVYFSL